MDGFVENAKKAIDDPARSLPGFLLSAGIGAAMAAANGRGGFFRLGAKIAGTAFAAGCVKELLVADRSLQPVGKAISDTWNDRGSLADNRAKIAFNTGKFTFDTALMTLGGGLGAGAVAVNRAMGRERVLFGTPQTIAGERTRSLSLGAATSEAPVFSVRQMPSMQMVPAGQLQSSAKAQLLKRDASGVPLPATMQGQVLWKREPVGITWQADEASVKVRDVTERFVQQTLARDYTGALKTAIESPVMQGVELNSLRRPHDVTIPATDLAKSHSVQAAMEKMSNLAIFKWQQEITNGQPGLQQLSAIVPRPVIRLKDGNVAVPLVDFKPVEMGEYRVQFPHTTIEGKPLSATQTAEINAIRSSQPGQRLLGETALFAFEEVLVHANQYYSAGSKIMSPTYAAFVRDFGIKHGTRPHLLQFASAMDSKHPMRELFMEQEVPMMLYDAGMPLKMIKHHFYFGARHMTERAPVIEFLEAREGLISKPTLH